MARRPAEPRQDAVAISIVNRQRHVRVAARWVERVVRRVVAAEGVTRAEISVTFVDDRRIARLHAEWFDDPSATDVITFPLSADGAPVLVGDLVVSAETARRRARDFGWTPRHELAYYVVHGLLHLTGHDDTRPASRRAMRARERVVMRAAGLPTPPLPAAPRRKS